MKILIENCSYDNSEIAPFLRANHLIDDKGKVRVIGYLYNKELKDCVFLLPKVILDVHDKVLGKYEPLDVLSGSIDEADTTFLYSFSIWMYRALNRYNQENKENKIVNKHSISSVDTSSNIVNSTFVDIILALERLANENKNFLLFTMQHLNAGYKKILWTQTISRRQPLLRKGKTPIYLDFFTKKKTIDYNEELLIIFFSILRYINIKYGTNTHISSNFDLIPDYLFEKYLDGYGLLRLQEIKYKYFSDRTLQIWRLCYEFFNKSEQIRSSNQAEDYLLAYKFDRIFEAMVDNLIGFKQEELPEYIKKKQEDDKIIDHIFIYRSLTNLNQDTYYIADSKYYPTGKGTEGTSFFKQYTYARNLRHEIMTEILKQRKGLKNDNVKIYCLDEKTEGYDIIPNFFLSTFVDNNFNYDIDGIKRREEEQDTRFVHFSNRLFDRETLLLSHYDINFLYVIKQYAINNEGCNKAFSYKIYKIFRNDILKRLNYEYLFYVLELKQKPEYGKEQKRLNDALAPIFRLVNGKLFCPKKDASYTNLILALENPERHITASKEDLEKENLNVLTALEKDFIIHKGFKIGDSIEDFLKKSAE